jgi:hypothetical protein
VSAIDLCTLADVRLALEHSPGEGLERDDLIEELITTASRAILANAGREFAPVTASATRDFDHLGGGRVSLAPCDLQTSSAATVTVLDGTSEDATVIAELTAVEWYGEPTTALDGVYTSLVVPALAGVTARRVVRVAGAWGFPDIPDDVRQACVVTVRSWLSKPISDVAAALELGDAARALGPGSAATFAVPTAAKRLYSHLRRHGIA